MSRRKRAPNMEWEFMDKMGIAGEEVIGKEVGSSPWLSHSLSITILVSFTVAGFRPPLLR